MTALAAIGGTVFLVVALVGVAIMLADRRAKAEIKLEMERDATDAEREAGQIVARRNDPGAARQRLRDGTF